MRTLALLIALLVPPIVTIPPDLDAERSQMFMFFMFNFDQQVCEGGPVQPAQFPTVNRCQGLI